MKLKDYQLNKYEKILNQNTTDIFDYIIKVANVSKGAIHPNRKISESEKLREMKKQKQTKQKKETPASKIRTPESEKTNT